MSKNYAIVLNAFLLLLSVAIACFFPASLFFTVYPGNAKLFVAIWICFVVFGNIWMFPGLWSIYYNETLKLFLNNRLSLKSFILLACEAVFVNPFSWILIVTLHIPIVFFTCLICTLLTAIFAATAHWCFLNLIDLKQK